MPRCSGLRCPIRGPAGQRRLRENETKQRPARKGGRLASWQKAGKQRHQFKARKGTNNEWFFKEGRPVKIPKPVDLRAVAAFPGLGVYTYFPRCGLWIRSTVSMQHHRPREYSRSAPNAALLYGRAGCKNRPMRGQDVHGSVACVFPRPDAGRRKAARACAGGVSFGFGLRAERTGRIAS